MVVTMPKFQRDIPTLAQVLAPLLSYKKNIFQKSQFWTCRPKSEFQRTVFAAERIHIEQVYSQSYPRFWFIQFHIFFIGRCPVRPPHLKKLWRGKWRDSLEKMRRYTLDDLALMTHWWSMIKVARALEEKQKILADIFEVNKTQKWNCDQSWKLASCVISRFLLRITIALPTLLQRRRYVLIPNSTSIMAIF